MAVDPVLLPEGTVDTGARERALRAARGLFAERGVPLRVQQIDVLLAR